jgi:RNA polymerase sigma factor (sigma-70 family)
MTKGEEPVKRRAGDGGNQYAQELTDGGNQYAQELIDRFGAQMLATARRYSSTDEDAEDAYQRATEIALVHRPTGERDDLLRWLRTTAKREALAIRRHRSRVVAVGAPESLPEAHHAGDPHQRAERLEQLRHGGEALRRLKPQEVRALQLRAEGYSYKEICELTGWTYTKVNRCLAEGRQAFLRSLSQIESGAECDRLAHHLSALADGEGTPADRDALRPHLATCLACRARLREYRAVPTRVAALVPLPALEVYPAAASQPLPPDAHPDPAIAVPSHPLRSLYDSIAAAAHDRWTSVTAATHERVVVAGDRLHQATELAAAQKAAAVAASAVALTGGGAIAGEHRNERASAPTPAIERQVGPRPGAVGEPSPAPIGTGEAPPQLATDDHEPTPPASTPRAAAIPAAEFGPELSPATPPPASQPSPPPAPAPATGQPEPGAFER